MRDALKENSFNIHINNHTILINKTTVDSDVGEYIKNQINAYIQKQIDNDNDKTANGTMTIGQTKSNQSTYFNNQIATGLIRGENIILSRQAVTEGEKREGGPGQPGATGTGQPGATGTGQPGGSKTYKKRNKSKRRKNRTYKKQKGGATCNKVDDTKVKESVVEMDKCGNPDTNTEVWNNGLKEGIKNKLEKCADYGIDNSKIDPNDFITFDFRSEFFREVLDPNNPGRVNASSTPGMVELLKVYHQTSKTPSEEEIKKAKEEV